MSEEDTGRSKRVRKETTHYKVEDNATKKEFEVEEGSGVELGEFQYFVKALDKHHGDSDLVKGLHSIMFGSAGKKTEAKKHIRQFNGFSEETKTDRSQKVLENKKKWTVAALKQALEVFGLTVSGTREELVSRLFDYLASPTVTKDADDAQPKKHAKASSTASAGKKRKAPKLDKNGNPKKKRAPSAFILYCQAHRPEVKKSHPDATFKDFAVILSQQWNSLDADDKAEWNEKAAEAKQRLIDGADEEGGDEEEEEEEEEEA